MRSCRIITFMVGAVMLAVPARGQGTAPSALATQYVDELAGLGLDVLPEEPVPEGSKLTGHPRVILTPHAAFFSVESERELRRKAAQNIVTWLATGRPDYVVAAGTRRP